MQEAFSFFCTTARYRSKALGCLNHRNKQCRVPHSFSYHRRVYESLNLGENPHN